MSINFKNAFGTYEAALHLRSKRAEVLSSNLVNADTPNYKARDFDFHKTLQSTLDAAKVSATTRQEVTRGMEMQYRVPTQPSVDGNTVDEHLEHAEFMRNSLEFQTTFTLLNSRIKGLMSAIKGE